MQRSSLPVALSTLKKWMEEKNCLKGNLPFQRHTGMWSSITQSNLIWAMLADSYIPPIVLLKDRAGTDEKGKDTYEYQILDGLQRLTTVFKFVNGEYALHSATPEVEVDGTLYDLAGCFFSDLSEECQQAITGYRFIVQNLENYTMEEAEKLFFNINSGVALSTIQKSKSKMGTELIVFLNDLLRLPFFTQGINITEAQAKREDDLCLLLQSMLLLDNMYDDRDYKSISTSTCLSYAESIRGKYIEPKRQILQETIEYLSEAFPRKNKFLRKNNVPIVIVCAHIAKLYGVEPESFYLFINEFASGVFEDYDEASGAGNVKVSKVKTRLEVMFSEMCRYFKLSVKKIDYPFAECQLRVDTVEVPYVDGDAFVLDGLELAEKDAMSPEELREAGKKAMGEVLDKLRELGSEENTDEEGTEEPEEGEHIPENLLFEIDGFDMVEDGSAPEDFDLDGVNNKLSELAAQISANDNRGSESGNEEPEENETGDDYEENIEDDDDNLSSNDATEASGENSAEEGETNVE